MKRRLVRWAAAGILIGGLVLEAISIVLHFLSPIGAGSWGLDHLQFAGWHLPSLGFLAAGVIVVVRRPRHPIGWLLVLTALAMLTGGLLYEYNQLQYQYGVLGIQQIDLALGALRLRLFECRRCGGRGVAIRSVSWLILWVAMLLFPTGRLPAKRWGPVGLFVVLFGTALVILRSLRPWGGAPDVAWLDWLEYRVDVGGNRLEVSGVLAFLSPAIVGAALISRYRAGGAEERHQIKWLALGATLLALVLLVSAGLTLAGAPAVSVTWLKITGSGLALLVLAAGAGIAILKYRLYDIDLVLRRTITFGSLGLFITLAYIGLVVGSSRILGNTGNPTLAISLVATGLVSVTFQPVRERAEHLASQLVFGDLAEPYEVLSGFSRQVGDSLLAEEILPLMAQAVARGVRARGARVRLFLVGGEEILESWHAGSISPEEEKGLVITRQEVIHADTVVGEIEILKARDDPIRPYEAKLLSDLAAQAGLALRNLRLGLELQNHLAQIRRQAEELESSQNRIMTAHLWAQLKLERELHERVERGVVASGQILLQAEQNTNRESDVLQQLLDLAVDEARSALDELRELSRGVFPPLLGEEGIVPALRSQIRKTDWRVHLELSGGIEEQRFNPHAEAAVYFCCVETMKHLSASRDAPPLVVELNAAGDVATFKIRAQTSAFGTTIPTHLLLEMADRVEALEGTLEVRQGTSEGTVVIGEVPV